MMQCNAMQCNAMQCNAMQCNALQRNVQVNVSTLINLYKGFEIDVQRGTLSLSVFVQVM